MRKAVVCVLMATGVIFSVPTAGGAASVWSERCCATIGVTAAD